ncbi:MAG: hypothetical protein WD154_06080 [Nitrosopumilaceae archaeon]
MNDAQILSSTVTTIGLIIDILGVSVLALITSRVLRHLLHASNTVTPDVHHERTLLTNRERWITIIGLGLIILGFIIQIFGTWMPDSF